jgi:hypothetical protein
VKEVALNDGRIQGRKEGRFRNETGPSQRQEGRKEKEEVGVIEHWPRL